MTEQITAERVLELLTRAVKRTGRDTIRPCSYVKEGPDGPVPYCVVACVFAEVGVSIESMVAFGEESLWKLYGGGGLNGIVDLSWNAALILNRAQSAQDAQDGNIAGSWGRALAAARRQAWRLGIIGKDHPLRNSTYHF